MANRTDTGASLVRGTNPQFMIDKILRNKIYSNRYWKEFCTGLTAESLVDEAINLQYIGGTYGGMRAPTKFIILILKMLQLAPEKEIVLEYIRNPDYKYVSALAIFYFRMVQGAVECHNVLEEYLVDNRKLRYRNEDGSFKIIFMDEFVDDLLRQEVYCSVTLPHIQSRLNLEETGKLQPRVSILEKQLEEELKLEAEEKARENQLKKEFDRDNNNQKEEKSSRSRSRSKSNDDNNDRKHRKKHSKKHKKSSRRRSRSRSSSDSSSRRRSNSRSNSHHRKKKSHHPKGDRKNDWRRLMSGKNIRRSRSNDRQYQQDNSNIKNNPPPKEGSIEAENILRASLGLKPL